MGVVNLIGATAFERDLESFHSGGIHSRYDTFVSGASVAPRKGNYLVDKSPIKPMPPRILATAQALALLCRLRGQHGALLIHQSGGRSVPLCFKQDEFRVSSRDVLLGVVEETPFYVGAAQYEYLGNTDFLLDVVRGDGDSFSVEASTGVRFLARSVKGADNVRTTHAMAIEDTLP
jgi:uncharacterized protein (DUF779 family)